MALAERLNEKKEYSKELISKAFNKMTKWAEKNPKDLRDWILSSIKNKQPLIVRVDDGKKLKRALSPFTVYQPELYVSEDEVRLMDEFKRLSKILSKESVRIKSMKVKDGFNDTVKPAIELELAVKDKKPKTIKPRIKIKLVK